MYCQTYTFYKNDLQNQIKVNPDDYYTEERGYGYAAFDYPESLPKASKQLLSGNWGCKESAFGSWEKSKSETQYGVESSLERYPIIFKSLVPEEGVYEIEVTIQGGESGLENIMIYTARRNLVAKEVNIPAGETYRKKFLVYVCPYIPAMISEPLVENAVYIGIAGNYVRISSITIKKTDAPVLFIAGDSTLTDQSAMIPYYPGDSCGGWAQMMLSFFRGIAVCNQAHSGLTTNCFRDDGHWKIVRDRIRPGDIFMIQFGHNDQKRRNLAAFGGYLNNLRWYIKQIRELGATPVLISPISRIPFIEQGTYQSILEDHAEACRHAAKELEVAFIDLHQKTFDYLSGLKEEAAKYFCKGDITHTNDFGAYRFASMVKCEIRAAKIEPLYDYLEDKENAPRGWAPDGNTAPAEKEALRGIYLMKPAYLDLTDDIMREQVAAAMAKGLTDPCVMHLHPLEDMPRGQFLFLLFKALRISSKRPVNGQFCDISRYEWDASYVQGAYEEKLIDPVTTKNFRFRPDDALTAEELASFLIRGIHARDERDNLDLDTCLKAAKSIGLLDEKVSGNNVVTRIVCYNTLVKMMENADVTKKELPKDIEIHPVG